MSLAPLRLAAPLVVAWLAGSAAAQTVQVQGTITDADGPVRLARVVVQADGPQGDTLAVSFTDSAGAFAVTVAGTPGEIGPAAADYAIGTAFPNPATGDLATVRYTTPGDRPEAAEPETFDALGRRTTAGAPLPAGVYLVRLRFADGSVSEARKLVVARGGVRVVAEHAAGGLGAPPLAVRAGARAATTVFVTVERAGYVTETRTADATGGATLAVTLSPADAPTAAVAPPGTVQAGTAITLDGSASAGASGEALRYSWAFGDGERGGAARVAHVYTEPGTYTVTLTVQGGFGATAQATAQVEVTAPPDPAGAAPVRVVVTGTTGAAIAGATVSLVGGTASATTDGEGAAVVAGVPTGVPAALAVSKGGFATQRVALDLPAAAEQATTVEVTLGARQPAQTLRRAERGGTVGGVEGVRVELPVEGLVRADGTPVTGDVSVSLTPVDVSDDDEIGAFPGAFAGVTPDGPAPLLLSYGVAEYVFEQDGEELNLAPGKTAVIEIPIYAAQDDNGDDLEPGDPFPLWSLNEMTGEWTLEGEGVVVASAASPTGLALRAEVSHFSWWNCDVAPDPYEVVPECEVEDEGGLPTLQLDETCYIEGYIDAGPGPRTRPNTTVGPGNTRPLPIPPGIDVVLEASVRNGTLRGEATVNGEPNGSGSVTIVLRPVDAGSGGSIAPDTTILAAIDPVGEVDTYTFASQQGRVVRATVSRPSGSSLIGTMAVAAPDGTTVGSEAFGSSAGIVQFTASQTGLYTITVDGTRNEPGGYTLDLIERTSQQIVPGTDASLAVGAAGGLAAYTFVGTAGQPFNLYLGSETLSSARAQVIAPDGTELFGLSTRQNGTGFGVLPVDGTYAILIDVPSGPGTLVTSLRSVPTVEIGDVVTGSLRQGERWNYLLTPSEERYVRARLVSTETQGFASVIPVDGPSPDQFAFDVRRLVAGTTYRLQVGSSSGAVGSFQAAAAPIAAPTPLSFDAAGRAEVSGEIAIPGDLRLYRIDTPLGSGLMTRLTASGDSPLGIEASVGVARLRPDAEYPTSNDVLQSPLYTEDARAEGAPAGLLEAYGNRLVGDNGFVIAVGPESQLDSGLGLAGDTPTGTFTLRADVVAPATAIEVDDDLAQCAGADTRSVRAAMFAATASTTVTACAGRYADAVSVPVLDGVTLAGTDRDAVVLAHEIPSSRLNSSIVLRGSWDDGALTIRDLTLEPSGFGTNLRGENLTVERVTVRPAAGVEAETIGAFQTSGTGARFEEVRVESAQSGIIMSNGDGTQVLASTFTGASGAMVSVQGNDVTVHGNTFEMTDGQAIRVGLGLYGGLTVSDNTITVDGDRRGLASDVVSVIARGASSPNAVRGNVVTIATDLDRPFMVEARGGAQVLVEDNEVYVTGDDDVKGLFASAQQAGSAVVIRNNVFDGVQAATAIDLFSTPDARVAFVNNSVRAAPDTQVSASSRFVTARTNSSAGGALPITVANNVLQSVGGVGVYTASGQTVTSDYNLLFGFESAYGGGAGGGGNDVTGQDPQFTGDRLDVAASSPAVDAGASSGAFPDVPAADIDGTARPQGAAVDIGAHER